MNSDKRPTQITAELGAATFECENIWSQHIVIFDDALEYIGILKLQKKILKPEFGVNKSQKYI